ncbi:MauE/DoxX family redox-associated membrane protein [Streptomyces sp. QH1-20]|uniref:MauE/DoxX family redox-associated membrane protein n=1 Tax=Streptomyces sp. QH1-20 TaxID=3240934 RepID=UPI003515165D
MGYVALGIRALLGAVFLASSIGKVTGRGAFGRFVSSVGDMRVVPRHRARAVARTVVCAEFVVWPALMAPVPAVAVAGFAVAAGLLVAFAAGIALSTRRGARTPCRCFGVSASPLGPRHIVRNLVLTALAVIGAAATLLDSGAAGPAGPGGAVVAVSGGLLLGALVAVLDDVLDLFRPVDRASGPARGR